MAIQTVFVGTTPGDDTGDPARTCFIKINDNFTQAENAASRLVATPAEAVAGTADKLTDTAGVKAHVDSRVTQSSTDTTPERLLKVGDFGLGWRVTHPTDWSTTNMISGIYSSDGGTQTGNAPYSDPFGSTLVMRYTAGISPEFSPKLHISYGTNLRAFMQSRVSSPWRELRHTGNTTVDGNGFIKVASPIVSLYRDRAESNGSAELEEMQFEHISTGHYRLTGVPELSRDGWYIETPKDRNGNVYFTLDYVESEGQLDVRTYTPDYSTGRAENGEPVDIIDGRFVSLRFAASPETTPPEES